jgi:amino acid transporter
MIQAGANDEPVPILILNAALGPRAGAAMSWLVVVAMWFCGLSCITSVSRAVFAFARDGGMFAWFRRMDATHHTPHIAIWTTAVAAFAALVYSGAYSVVTSMSVVALYIAYIMPTLLSWRHNVRGPWSLGRWSAPVRVTAIAWTAFICLIMVMPPNELAGKSVGAVAVILAAYYFLRARRTFQGPSWTKT